MMRSLLVIICLVFLAGCGEQGGAGAAKAREEKRANAVIEGLKLTSTVRGKKGWEFFAEDAELFHEQKLIRAETITVCYYRDEAVISTLTAQRCRLNTENNDTFAYGQVKLVTEKGEVLYTEELCWLAATERIYSDKPVTVLRGENIIYADGMSSDTNLEKVKFRGEVRMEIRDVEDAKELRD